MMLRYTYILWLVAIVMECAYCQGETGFCMAYYGYWVSCFRGLICIQADYVPCIWTLIGHSFGPVMGLLWNLLWCWYSLSHTHTLHRAKKKYRYVPWRSLKVHLPLTLLTCRKWRAPTNASKWRVGFNSAFKGLNKDGCLCVVTCFFGREVPAFSGEHPVTLKTEITFSYIWIFSSHRAVNTFHVGYKSRSVNAA